MRTLLIVGALLVVIGVGGAWVSCRDSEIFSPGADTAAAQAAEPAGLPPDDGPDRFTAAVFGLVFAVGIGCLAVGAGLGGRERRPRTGPTDPHDHLPL
ncbi:MAG: hypothetical protein AB7O67_11615 [Vicinamibacterales bacterium]